MISGQVWCDVKCRRDFTSDSMTTSSSLKFKCPILFFFYLFIYLSILFIGCLMFQSYPPVFPSLLLPLLPFSLSFSATFLSLFRVCAVVQHCPPFYLLSPPLQLVNTAYTCLFKQLFNSIFENFLFSSS